jgi:hypothetical protein
MVNSGNKFKTVAGWNAECKEFHRIARENFLIWLRNGKIRNGEIFDKMKESRANFKTALNYCKKNELKIKKENLIQSFAGRNKIHFWNEIKNEQVTNNIPIVHLDNKNTPDEIINIFNNKYKSILDDPRSQSIPLDFHQLLNNINKAVHVNNCQLLTHHIDKSIEKLNIGIGCDFVHTNHLRYSGCKFRLMLSKLFSSFINHNYVPTQMLYGEIRPRIKNKRGSKTDSNNYRPVMNSSNFLKIFDYCIMPHLERNIKLDMHQFGFRKNTGCTTATLVLKETLLRYTNKGSNVHCAMVDLSKAFDKINYNILLGKLCETKIPVPIIKILHYMNEHQYVNVKFNDFIGERFKVRNGIRQGGVNSALLFNFYINDILKTISELSEGCILMYTKVNILGYADDLILLCPSANGLQFLIDKLSFMIENLCLNINTDKSVYIVFRCKNYLKFDFNPVIRIQGQCLKLEHQCTYLGIVLTDDMFISKDIERACHCFLQQFNSMYSKFYFSNKEILCFLFGSYCTNFYAAELWFNKEKSSKELDTISITYHKALKRILGLSKWDNNHNACEMTGFPIFKHFINSKLISFLFSIIKSKSPCLTNLKDYFKHDSFILKYTQEIFSSLYGVENVLNNDLLALKSRINFVQMNEERSNYVPFFRR